ncbi:hypothetical protein ID866_12524, partial [Astraeus odoratus]
TRIVSGSSDKTVRVWDAERGTRIVSGSDDKTVRVCKAEGDVHTGILLEDNPGQGMDHSMFSSSNAHALCAPYMFLYDASVWQSYVEYPVLLCKDGWVRGPKGRLLLWVPHALQKPFNSMQNVLVIPSGACIELDLSKMVHGTRWQMCFNGNLPTCRTTE